MEVSSMKLGLMIPDFPGQTHVAMWRVGQAMRELGVDVQFLSTHRAAAEARCHDFLIEEATRTHYIYPPNPVAVLVAMMGSPFGVWRSLQYIARLRESNLSNKVRCLLFLLCAADLKSYCQRHDIQHVFIHSCADAAHIGAMNFLLGGATYSLRLGGDLQVYGRDHDSKMSHAAFIAAAAEPTRQQVLDQVGIPAQQVYSVWLGVDTQRFVPPPNREFEVGKLRLITVARLNFVKGHSYAIEAIRSLLDKGLDIHYTLVGSGPYEAKLRQLINQLGLSDCVSLVGAQGESNVIKALQGSDVFVLPSINKGEASPVAALEAMSCGLPAVCSIIGGTPDIVTDGVNGFLVEQKDAKALAERLYQLAQDIDLRKRMSQSARERAVESFDCRISAQRILDAIKTHAGI
jgi:colanic acid/amylovoran biosynthesis glycosyltransferase